ncbi:MAG TPA: pyridoxal kinase [Rhizomicrobium sp.]|jgi:pyridoxine kinase|nr:pyridoxal kinase [Rhizomicrobium sp.]
MNILSFQSEVVYGHVGHGAARFALQRLGHEVWALPTVLLSSHAGYPHVEGESVAAERLRCLLDGLSANGWLAQCDAILSGYLGNAEQAEMIADAVSEVKRANTKAFYCLDPVIGDDGRAYAKPGVAEAMARTLLPLADIVTPNAFELVTLSGLPVRNVEDARVAIDRLGKPLVTATSLPDGRERIGILAATRDEAWFASARRFAEVPHGGGDLFAALFVAQRLSGAELRDSLARAMVPLHRILSASRGCSELRLIAEQDALSDTLSPNDLKIEQI